jgi:tRNA 2-selenouridine synthase
MGVEKIHINKFLELRKIHLIIDVRSPAEFNQAHVLGAVNIPLFSNEERKQVGTTYKQVSREKAIKIGLDFFGPKMKNIVEEIEKILDLRNTKNIVVYCWRGGMRSAAIAWLLDLYGFKVYTLQGGYKSYRNFLLSLFQIPYKIQVIAGNTGSGKTKILQELEKQNELILDLEGIAKHKGSAFGNLENTEQPSQEQFENLIAEKLFECKSHHSDKRLWIEDESSFIGKNYIPKSFHEQMQNAPLFFIEIPFQERLKTVINEYGIYEKEKIKDAILNIKKRLGGLETKNALQFLEENNIEACFEILLKYYDKLYKNSLERKELWKERTQFINAQISNAEQITQTLLSIIQKS